MKATLLFPPFLRPIGIGMALIGFVLGYFVLYQQYSIPALSFGEPKTGIAAFFQPPMNLTDELAITLIIVGLLFTAFSRLKKEDELTIRLRLDALIWAVLINYGLVFAAYLINNQFIIKPEESEIMDFEAWSVLSDLNWIVYALFSPLLIFIARFYYSVWQYQRDKIRFVRDFQLPRVPFRYIGMTGFILFVFIISLAIAEPHYPALGKYLSETYIHTAWYCLPLFLILLIFSKDRQEDEYLRQLRLESWQITFYIHYALILLLTFTVFGTSFFIVMLLTVHIMPLLFVIVHYVKKRQSKMMSSTALISA